MDLPVVAERNTTVTLHKPQLRVSRRPETIKAAGPEPPPTHAERITSFSRCVIEWVFKHRITKQRLPIC